MNFSVVVTPSPPPPDTTIGKIIIANQKQECGLELNFDKYRLLQAWKNAIDWVTIVSSFASDWLAGWREFSRSRCVKSQNAE